MPTKIRLQRHGKKGQAFYHIVIADGRAPRDGKFIERLGTYNPNSNPAIIDIDFDKTITWLKNGAQPSDTCRAILSYKGILHKYHLLKGIAKGAHTEEQVEEKFAQWLEGKESRITGKKDMLVTTKESAAKTRMDEETKSKEARAAKIAAKNAPAPEETPAEEEIPTEETPKEGEAPASEENTEA
ncbi:MAG: 30S ribosomal protein S16 [Bacteroidetes bacterium]|nr:30S ribosomal protein S16 [Bacteroidota bacterium]